MDFASLIHSSRLANLNSSTRDVFLIVGCITVQQLFEAEEGTGERSFSVKLVNMAGDTGKDPSAKPTKRKGSAKARKAAKAAEAAAAAAATAGVDGLTLADRGKGGGGSGGDPNEVQARTAAGVLASEARARDIKIQSFSLSFHSKILVEDSTIELNYGRRWVLFQVVIGPPCSRIRTVQSRASRSRLLSCS